MTKAIESRGFDTILLGVVGMLEALVTLAGATGIVAAPSSVGSLWTEGWNLAAWEPKVGLNGTPPSLVSFEKTDTLDAC